MDEKIVKDSQGLANDCISRQAAIDAFGERPMVWVGSDYGLGARNQYDADVLALETVLPAQPERKVFEGMSDAEFEKWLYEHGICNPDIHESIPCEVVPLLIDDAINELPAQQERKRGKWIAVTEDGDVYKRICSCCGQEAFFQNDDPDELYDGGRYELSDFCPHCGADMREEKNDNA